MIDTTTRSSTIVKPPRDAPWRKQADGRDEARESG
jgi:hypothetical protein